jgi:hypothetical protein
MAVIARTARRVASGGREVSDFMGYSNVGNPDTAAQRSANHEIAGKRKNP